MDTLRNESSASWQSCVNEYKNERYECTVFEFEGRDGDARRRDPLGGEKSD